MKKLTSGVLSTGVHTRVHHRNAMRQNLNTFRDAPSAAGWPPQQAQIESVYTASSRTVSSCTGELERGTGL
uniref:Uncharacterized protein n=1 Tax=mine drainage metagenome TaxID=410659 RepID=E6PN28_9ZZZZ